MPRKPPKPDPLSVTRERQHCEPRQAVAPNACVECGQPSSQDELQPCPCGLNICFTCATTPPHDDHDREEDESA